MKILISGATGFLGRALVHRLASGSHDVVVPLRPGSRLGDLESLPVTIGRFSSTLELACLVAEWAPEVVVHTAGRYGRQGETDDDLEDANIRFGLDLLRALNAVPRTGTTRRTFINTGTALPPAVSRYAESKHRFSALGRRLAEADVGAARFLNVELQHMYGPGDDVKKFTASVFRACRDNVSELVLTEGEQRRDLIYIDDVTSAYETLMFAAGQFGASADVPLGSGTAPTIREFVERVRELAGASTRLLFGALPYRDNEVMHCVADLSTLRLLGWAPRCSLDDGIRKTLTLDAS